MSWWLSRGLAPEEGPELAEGEKKHEAASADLKGIEVHEARAREAEAGVLYFAIAASIVAILGLKFLAASALQIGQTAIALIWLLAAVYFLYRAETLAKVGERLVSERVVVASAMAAVVIATAAVSFPGMQAAAIAQGFEAIALVWLIGASFFLYRSIGSLEFARSTRAKYDVQGDLVYIDSTNQQPKRFVSKKYGLSGRPDAVVMDGEHHIPVEIKTGRVPRGPLFSHILQVVAYCILLEEEYGRAPPYGIIRYETTNYEIEYNEDQKRLLLEKLAEMRDAIVKGEAHRNHSRPGKCIHCSRRSGCPERLA
ncbi:MAG TPA: CRISPR-associated protein Cas4 [Thermoplasmata archaeon]|nr:CRISPR-associated protein Cas4 [Thermoplasmata archaeon]